jgi:hypothetical protein
MQLTTACRRRSFKLHRRSRMLAAALLQRQTIYDTRQDIGEEIFFDAEN